MKKYDLSSVIYLGSGAAPLSKETELEACRNLGVGDIGQGKSHFDTLYQHFKQKKKKEEKSSSQRPGIICDKFFT